MGHLCLTQRQEVWNMENIQRGYTGLHLLVDLNWDRFLYIGTLAAALGCGALIGAIVN